MNEASRYLRGIAERVAASYTLLPGVAAAMVTGSVAEGLADNFSDIDMTIYYESLPSQAEMDEARRRAGGSATRTWTIGDREQGTFAESFPVGDVEVQIGHATVAAWERDMAVVLEQHVADTPLQKALSGTLECVPLYGAERIEAWKRRAADYPDGLARAMVTHHLRFFPLWGLAGRMYNRDTTIWHYQALVEAAHNILGVLAGLNRLYFSTFQFKRTGRFIAHMQVAPADLAARLERLFHATSEEAGIELERLVGEVLTLVEHHMPDVDTTAARKRLGWRQRPWFPPPA